MPRAPLAIVAVAFVLIPLAIAARADAYIYWANTDTIGRADLDGTDVDRSFITGIGHVRGVAVDADHIYWANGATDTIGRADLDGTDVDKSFITGADYPSGIAVGARHIYWANVHLTAGGGSIGRAALDGTHVDQRFIVPHDGGAVLGGVAVDATHVYWTDFLRIGRAGLDGSGGGFIRGGDGLGATSVLAVDANHLYWTYDYQVARADLDGYNLNPGFVTGAFSKGVAVDAGHVYWTNDLPGTGANGIGRSNLDGTDVNQRFIDGATNPFGIAVDNLPVPDPPDTTPPETTITKGAPNKIKRGSFKFEFVSSEPGSTFACKLDERAFRPCTSPKLVTRLDVGKHRFKVRAVDAAGNFDPHAAKDDFRVVR